MKLKQNSKLTQRSQNKKGSRAEESFEFSFATANDMYPSLLLNESVDVIDISDNFRSCHGNAVDRALLVNSMSPEVFSRLAELCSKRTISDPSDDMVTLDIKLFGYRAGLCKRLCSFPMRLTLLYFAGSVDGFAPLFSSNPTPYPKTFHDTVRCRDKKAEPSFTNAIGTLFNYADDFGVPEAKTFLRSIADKLTQKHRRIISDITFYDDTETIMDDNQGIKPGPYGLIFISLLSVLDTVSTDGQIGIKLHGDETTFEVDMYTKSPVAEYFIGAIDDVMSLSPHIRGSGTHLAVASATAADAYMFLRAYTESDRLHFSFGAYTDSYLILELKCRDPEVRVVTILNAVLDVLASATVTPQAEEEQVKE